MRQWRRCYQPSPCVCFPPQNYPNTDPADFTDTPPQAYAYHKPVGTLCNDGANTCQFDGCTGSRCQLFESTDISGSAPSPGYDANGYVPLVCFNSSDDGSESCMVACIFQEGGPCVSTFAYAETEHGKAQEMVGLFRKAGKTCMDFQGYCEETCDEEDGNCVSECTAAKVIDPISALLDADILGWMVDNWYIVVSIEVGCALMAFFIRWCVPGSLAFTPPLKKTPPHPHLPTHTYARTHAHKHERTRAQTRLHTGAYAGTNARTSPFRPCLFTTVSRCAVTTARPFVGTPAGKAAGSPSSAPQQLGRSCSVLQAGERAQQNLTSFERIKWGA